jgi:phosphatidylglycerophosphate synthase
MAPLSLPALIGMAFCTGAPWGLAMFMGFYVLLRFRLVGRGCTSDPTLRASRSQLGLAMVTMVLFALLFANCLWGEGRTHTLPQWMAVTFAVVNALFFLMQVGVVVWYGVERMRQRSPHGAEPRP